jgi:diguanylate cyclase (GGDEF)-like protein
MALAGHGNDPTPGSSAGGQGNGNGNANGNGNGSAAGQGGSGNAGSGAGHGGSGAPAGTTTPPATTGSTGPAAGNQGNGNASSSSAASRGGSGAGHSSTGSSGSTSGSTSSGSTSGRGSSSRPSSSNGSGSNSSGSGTSTSNAGGGGTSPPPSTPSTPAPNSGTSTPLVPTQRPATPSQRRHRAATRHTTTRRPSTRTSTPTAPATTPAVGTAPAGFGAPALLGGTTTTPASTSTPISPPAPEHGTGSGGAHGIAHAPATLAHDINGIVSVVPAWAWVLLGILAAFGFLSATLAAAFARRAHYADALVGRIRTAAITDPLTGLFNRRGFGDALEQEIARARRFEHPLAVAFLDVRGLKAVNDDFGHQAGDDLLKSVAALLRRTSRQADIVARVGGDEMAVALIEQDRAGAVAFARRIAAEVPHARAELGVLADWDLTVGVAVFPEDGDAGEELLAAADRRLYMRRGIALSPTRR